MAIALHEQHRGMTSVLTPDQSLIAIEQSPKDQTTLAQKRFMELTINHGKAFWHDFGEGKICILDVSQFLNHGVDVELLNGMASDIAKKLSDVAATVALTAASGGNIITVEVCHAMGIPRMVSATKKANILQVKNGYYGTEGHSYTSGHGIGLAVTRSLLNPDDRVLIVDDFLDTGKMTTALVDLVTQAGAQVVGFAYAVNKIYAGGETVVNQLVDTHGVPSSQIASFISIDNMDHGVVHFQGFANSFSLRNQS